MSEPCTLTSTFSHHASAVFRRSSIGDIDGAHAAAAHWQQQQPCLLSSALLQWFSGQTKTSPVSAVASASLGSDAASDTAVYCSGATAFDLFACNGGNVRYALAHFATDILF
jgi:hypothetical protein